MSQWQAQARLEAKRRGKRPDGDVGKAMQQEQQDAPRTPQSVSLEAAVATLAPQPRRLVQTPTDIEDSQELRDMFTMPSKDCRPLSAVSTSIGFSPGPAPSTPGPMTPQVPEQSVDEPMQNRKVFIGGIPQEMTQLELEAVLKSHGGRVKKVWLQKHRSEGKGQSKDSQNRNHRGFGFAIFCDSHTVDELLGGPSAKSKFIKMECGRSLEVKRAVSSNAIKARQAESPSPASARKEASSPAAPKEDPAPSSPPQQATQPAAVHAQLQSMLQQGFVANSVPCTMGCPASRVAQPQFAQMMPQMAQAMPQMAQLMPQNLQHHGIAPGAVQGMQPVWQTPIQTQMAAAPIPVFQQGVPVSYHLGPAPCPSYQIVDVHTAAQAMMPGQYTHAVAAPMVPRFC